MNSYDYLLILVVVIGFLIGLTLYLGFKVPLDTSKPIQWLWAEYKSCMIIHTILLVLVVILTVIIFLDPQVKNRSTVLSYSGVFTYSTAILLLYSFFTIPKLEFGDYDQYPLIFMTGVFFISLGLITGIADSYKESRHH